MTRRRKLALGAAALVVVAAAGAIAAVFLLHGREAPDVRGSSSVEFTPTLPKPPPPPPKQRKVAAAIAWPAFGHDAERLHVGWGLRVRPPYRRDLGRARAEPRRVLAVDRLRPPLRRGRRRLGARAQRRGRARAPGSTAAHRCAAASPAIGPASGGTVYAVFLNRPPCNAKTTTNGEVVALVRRDRSGALAADDRPERDVAGRRRGTRLRRRLARQGLRAERADGPDRLGVQDRRGGQGRRGGRGPDAVRRLVRRARVRARHAHRPAGLARERGQPPVRAFDLLLDAGGRVRPRLHRRDRRQGLLVRRREREAALVAEHRRVRLRLAGRLEPARLRRLVRRHRSTRSTPPRATWSGGSRRTGRSPARRA